MLDLLLIYCWLPLDVFGSETSGFVKAEMGTGDSNLNNAGTALGSEG